MNGESFQGIWDNSPLIAWIHNLSKNHFKYLKAKINEFAVGRADLTKYSLTKTIFCDIIERVGIIKYC